MPHEPASTLHKSMNKKCRILHMFKSVQIKEPRQSLEDVTKQEKLLIPMKTGSSFKKILIHLNIGPYPTKCCSVLSILRFYT